MSDLNSKPGVTNVYQDLKSAGPTDRLLLAYSGLMLAVTGLAFYKVRSVNNQMSRVIDIVSDALHAGTQLQAERLSK